MSQHNALHSVALNACKAPFCWLRLSRDCAQRAKSEELAALLLGVDYKEGMAGMLATQHVVQPKAELMHFVTLKNAVHK